MKKLPIIIAGVIIAAMLTGCATQKTTKETTVPEVTTETTESETSVIPTEKTDFKNYYNLTSIMYGDKTIDVLQLKNLDPTVTEEINRTLFQFTVDDEEYFEEDTFDTTCTIIPVNDTVFSLLVTKDLEYECIDAVCYTFDTKTGKELTNSEILSMAGIKEAEFNEYAFKAAQNATNTIISSSTGKMPNEITYTGLNIYMPMFLDSKMNLCMISELPYDVGAGQYLTVYDNSGRLFDLTIKSFDTWGIVTECKTIFNTTITTDSNGDAVDYKTVEFVK